MLAEQVPARGAHGAAAAPIADPGNVAPSSLKPYSAIPGPKGYPLIGNLPAYIGKTGYKLSKMHEVSEREGGGTEREGGEEMRVSKRWTKLRVV